MTKLAVITAVCTAIGISAGLAGQQGQGQARHFPLESADRLVLHHVAATPATLHGKKGLKLARPGTTAPAPVEQLAVLPDVVFSNGVIEVELAGSPEPGAAEGARGFVGIAFRLQQTKTPTTRSTCAPPTAAPTIRNGGITRSSTSRSPTGPGSGCARKRPAGTSRTSISSRASGPESGSTCAATRRASSSTAAISRRWSSTMSSRV